jgi:ankyrin repeat protein
MGEDKAIHKAAVEGDVKKLKALLDEDPALLHQAGLWQRTPLHAAAQAGQVECVRFLIEQGAEVDARDRLHSWTPLFSSLMPMHHPESRSKQLACARVLLEHGADPNARDTHRRETPIFDACTAEGLNLLAEFGADFDVVSAEDEYAYESNARSGWDLATLRFWLSRGVNVNHIPGYGSPVLVAVMEHLSTDVTGEDALGQISELLEYGADTEVAELLNGNTALHTAAQNGRTDLATILLDAGASPNSRARQGETPLHVATAENKLEVVELLLKRGADPNAQTLWGKPPLDYATEPGVRKILEGLTNKTVEAAPTPEELVERLLNVPSLQGMTLEPCSDEEISHLEQTFGVNLPESYKKFLRLMGRGERYFLECDHWDAFYPELLQMGQGEQYKKRCAGLPDDYFVFAQRLSVSLFFVADGTDDDPPIYSFDWETYEKVYDSFWDFFKEMVILNEVHGG